MAGDWIKVEGSTPRKPEVLALASLLSLSRRETVGLLVEFWIWTDSQTVDGNAHGVTSALLDELFGVTGFTDAMATVGWMTTTDDGLSVPHFEWHNGKSAKRRALTARRAAKCKQKSNAKGNGASVTSALPREEKRREEKKEETPKPPQAGAGEVSKAKKKRKKLDTNVTWDGVDYDVPEDLLQDWKRRFTRIDVDHTLIDAAAWRVGSGKSYKRNSKHLTSWLTRANNAAPAPPPRGYTDEELAAMSLQDLIERAKANGGCCSKEFDLLTTRLRDGTFSPEAYNALLDELANKEKHNG